MVHAPSDKVIVYKIILALVLITLCAQVQGVSFDTGFNLEMAVRDVKLAQDLELESLCSGAGHSQVVKDRPTANDSGSRDCVKLASPTAVSRFNMTAGYTQGHFKIPKAENVCVNGAGQPFAVTSSDTRLWEFGMSGKIAPPKDHYHWNCIPYSSYLKQFYLIGFSHVGRGGKRVPLTSKSTPLRLHVDHITTFDIQGGLGYLFDLNWVGIGVTCGYAYDTDKLKLQKTEVPPYVSLTDLTLYATRYKATWKGPWIGGELIFDVPLCTSFNWTVSLGAEYHKNQYNFHHHWISANPSPKIIFREEGSSPNGHGAVIYLATTSEIAEKFVIGANLKYRHFFAHLKHRCPNDSENRSTDALEAFKELICITCELGYVF